MEQRGKGEGVGSHENEFCLQETSTQSNSVFINYRFKAKSLNMKVILCGNLG